MILNNKNAVYNLFSKINEYLNKTPVKRACFALVILSSFIFIYIFNIKHLLFGDDWWYSLSLDESRHLQSFKDILDVQYEHYFIWGGRIIVHIIAQSLLLSGLEVADILNSFAFVGLTLVIYTLSNNTKILRPSLLILITMFVWFLQPAFGSTLLWITGSANYLWGTLIILTFLIPYVKYTFTLKNSRNNIFSVAMFFFGIIAGWTNENTVVALLFMLIVFLIYYKKQTGKIPLWAITGLIGVFIGAVFMIGAPGNYVRMDAVINSNYGGKQSIIYIFLSRFFGAISAFYYYALVPAFIFFILFWLYLSFGNKKDTNIPVIFLAILFFAGAVVATLAMSASPIFPGRAAFGLICFILVACGILYANLDFSKVIIPRLSYTIVVFCLLLFTADYYRGYRSLDMMQKHMQARVETIEEGKRNGQTDFILEDRLVIPPNRFTHFFELTPDSTDWHNRTYSQYYNIHTIIVK